LRKSSKFLPKLKTKDFARMVSLIFILTPKGFPEVHSWKQNENHAELLLEVSLPFPKLFQALGQNLRKLLDQCPSNGFSAATCFKIGI
jgi:hypothetical protein